VAARALAVVVTRRPIRARRDTGTRGVTEGPGRAVAADLAGRRAAGEARALIGIALSFDAEVRQPVAVIVEPVTQINLGTDIPDAGANIAPDAREGPVTAGPPSARPGIIGIASCLGVTVAR